MIAALLAGVLLAAPTPRLGVDVSIERPTSGTVVSLGADIAITSEVWGDVVALGGDVDLSSAARVHGDVVAIGGTVRGAGNVAGRIVNLDALGGVLTPVRGGSAGVVPESGLACLRVGGWVVLATVLALLARRRVKRGADELARHPWRVAAVGGLTLIVWLATSILAIAVAGSLLGGVLFAASVGGFVIAKAIGIASLAWAAGSRLAAWLPLPLRGEIPRTGVAMLALVALSLVPVVGSAAWVLASVVGIGSVVSGVLSPRPVALALARVALR